MIKAFMVGGVPITLVSDDLINNPERNIYSADSMTLLVGPNGSGKTKTLVGLARLVQQPSEEPDFYVDWRDEEECENTHVIYFTPIPFPVERPVSGPRLTYLQPSAERVVPDFDISDALSTAFGVDATPTLVFTDRYTAIVQRIWECIVKSDRRRTAHFLDDWIQNLLARYSQNMALWDEFMVQRRQSGQTLFDSYESDSWGRLNRERHEIVLEFEKGLRDILAEATGPKLRALSLAHSQRATEPVMLALLEKIGLTISARKRSNHPKAIRVYEEIVERMVSLARVLRKMSNLRRDSYKLTREQWNSINKISLSGIARLSNKRFSSGTYALLNQFATLKKEILTVVEAGEAKNLLLLIDEGDAFLHIEWQQKYVDYLDKTIANFWRDKFNCIQVVIATHSPVLMSDFPRNHIHRLAVSSKSRASLSHSGDIMGESFGAPLDAVIHSIAGAGTMGHFSARIIGEIVAAVNSGEDVDEYRMSIIDDPVIRAHIERIREHRARLKPINKNADKYPR